jgi:hypothetical protein
MIPQSHCQHRATELQGAQERFVPVTKGSVPEAPDGGHNSQAGTLLDAVPVALADDPPEFGDDEEPARGVPDALDLALAVPPPAEELVVAVPAFEPAGVAPLMVGVVG